jgi:hypothetical protein
MRGEPHGGVCAFIKETDSSLNLSAVILGEHWKTPIRKPGREPSPDTGSASTLILGFLDFQPPDRENKCLCFPIPPSMVLLIL